MEHLWEDGGADYKFIAWIRQHSPSLPQVVTLGSLTTLIKGCPPPSRGDGGEAWRWEPPFGGRQLLSGGLDLFLWHPLFVLPAPLSLTQLPSHFSLPHPFRFCFSIFYYYCLFICLFDYFPFLSSFLRIFNIIISFILGMCLFCSCYYVSYYPLCLCFLIIFFFVFSYYFIFFDYSYSSYFISLLWVLF